LFDFGDNVDCLWLVHKEEVHPLVRWLSLLYALFFHHLRNFGVVELIERGRFYFIIVSRRSFEPRIEADGADFTLPDNILLPLHRIQASISIAACVHVGPCLIFVWNDLPRMTTPRLLSRHDSSVLLASSTKLCLTDRVDVIG